MPGLEKAYALHANPFSLEGGLPAGVPNELGDLLQSAPLQMLKESKLVPYYCDEVYAKKASLWNKTPYQFLEHMLRERGYNDSPKALDPNKRSRVILIRGPKGTGKTTLAHRMMRFLKDCDPVSTSWKFLGWAPDRDDDNALQQATSLAKFQIRLRGEGKGRILCLMEDIVSGVEGDIFRIFKDEFSNSALFFFITSSDAKIRTQSFSLTNPPVIAFDTGTLSPDMALAYCRKRIKAFRTGETPAWMAGDTLFPFTSESIQRSLSPGARTFFDTPGTVALRELNVKFAGLLDDTRNGLADNFDILNVPATEASRYLIDPTRDDSVQEAA